MRRAVLALPLLAACATAPQPKMSWGEAGFQSAETEENTAEKPVSAKELAARQKLGPLAAGTLRFGGVERVLRQQSAGQPMPADGVRAWSGLFQIIDGALGGKLRASRNELVRARVVCRAERELDEQAYGVLPNGLDAAIEARIEGIAAELRGRRERAREPGPLAWPVHPAIITSLFGPRLDPLDHQSWKRHEGVDIAAEKGELVTAAASGVVTEADTRSGYGLLVAIRHPDGSITRYGHLSQLLTRQGMRIERGGAVGLAGSTGRSTGPHVHFEVWRHGRAVDPLEELGDPDAPDVSRYVSSN